MIVLSILGSIQFSPLPLSPLQYTQKCIRALQRRRTLYSSFLLPFFHFFFLGLSWHSGSLARPVGGAVSQKGELGREPGSQKFRWFGLVLSLPSSSSSSLLGVSRRDAGDKRRGPLGAPPRGLRTEIEHVQG